MSLHTQTVLKEEKTEIFKMPPAAFIYFQISTMCGNLIKKAIVEMTERLEISLNIKILLCYMFVITPQMNNGLFHLDCEKRWKRHIRDTV